MHFIETSNKPNNLGVLIMPKQPGIITGITEIPKRHSVAHCVNPTCATSSANILFEADCADCCCCCGCGECSLGEEPPPPPSENMLGAPRQEAASKMLGCRDAGDATGEMASRSEPLTDDGDSSAAAAAAEGCGMATGEAGDANAAAATWSLAPTAAAVTFSSTPSYAGKAIDVSCLARTGSGITHNN